MTKLLRFAGVALLALTIGVFGCGDDADPVTPVTPVTPVAPPPPVVVTMAPASQTIGVGGTVIFAVSVSGGVAGEAASWTCASSDPSKATVIMTSAGCAATAVAAGGVTITAAVTKGGATVNTAAGLTILEDMAERALLFIASIKNSDKDDEDDELLSRRVSVTLSVELGDQMIRQLSVLVDGVVAEIRSFDGASVVAAAPEGEEGERAAQQAVHPFVLSFNSAEYDAVTGEPTYMNGERMISAKLMVASSDEPIESGSHPREFDNGDGVHVTVSGLGEGAMNSTTGQRWYGGPKAALEMTALPVLYSGGSAASVSVTLLAFCGADAATETSETSVTFTPECDATSNTKAIVIDEVVTDPAGDFPVFVIGDAEADILGDHVFPLYLDYEGPEPPIFNANPNDREDGWLNAAVKLTGKYSSTSNKDGWLRYGADDPGVGGYVPQLRISATTPDIVDGARAESASSSPTMPAASKANIYCVIASATDLLGNESKRPKAGTSCASAAMHEGALGTKLDEAETALEDAAEPTADLLGDVQKARIALSSIKAGVDLTKPTIRFTGVSPTENDRDLQREFQVQVTDSETNASKLHSVPVLAKVEIRNAKGKVLCGNDDDSGLPGEEKATGECILNAENGLNVDEDGALVTTTGVAAAETVGYYTFTALSRDKAGNRSIEISRVALEDMVTPGAGLIVGAFDAKKSSYPVTVTATDNLSIRDGYLAMMFEVAGEFRLPKVTVDAYNDALTKSVPLSITIGAFRALQLTTAEPAGDEDDDDFGALNTVAAGAAEGIASIDVVVRDQSSNHGTDDDTGGDSEMGLADTDLTGFAVRANDAQSTTHFEAFVEEDDLDIDDVIEISVLVVGDGEIAIAALLGDNPNTNAEETDFVLEAAVEAVPFKNPFLRVDYYALGDDDSYRFIGSQLANSAGLEDTDDASATDPNVDRRTYTYEMDITAAMVYAAADDDGKGDYGDVSSGATLANMRHIIAVGVTADGLGLRSQPVPIAIDK